MLISMCDSQDENIFIMLSRLDFFLSIISLSIKRITLFIGAYICSHQCGLHVLMSYCFSFDGCSCDGKQFSNCEHCNLHLLLE